MGNNSNVYCRNNKGNKIYELASQDSSVCVYFSFSTKKVLNFVISI